MLIEKSRLAGKKVLIQCPRPQPKRWMMHYGLRSPSRGFRTA